jgi:signal transduction histidine kinase
MRRLEVALAGLAGAAAGLIAGLGLARRRVALEEPVRSLREARRRAVSGGDEERGRIARDLHRSTQQRLLVGAMSARRLASRARVGEGDSGELAAQLEQLATDLDAANDELRGLVAEIMPPVLADSGLAAALQELAIRVPARVRFDPTDTLGARFAAEVERGVYFAAAGALAVLLDEAEAAPAPIDIALAADEDRLELTVAGDGVARLGEDKGEGWRAVEDRVDALDGRLEVRSEDQSAVIRLVVPRPSGQAGTG